MKPHNPYRLTNELICVCGKPFGLHYFDNTEAWTSGNYTWDSARIWCDEKHTKTYEKRGLPPEEEKPVCDKYKSPYGDERHPGEFEGTFCETCGRFKKDHAQFQPEEEHGIAPECSTCPICGGEDGEHTQTCIHGMEVHLPPPSQASDQTGEARLALEVAADQLKKSCPTVSREYFRAVVERAMNVALSAAVADKQSAERKLEEAQQQIKTLTEERELFQIGNDTDHPTWEVMGKISDLVTDFRPDADSHNSGTIIDRAEAAVSLAKRTTAAELARDEAVKERDELKSEIDGWFDHHKADGELILELQASRDLAQQQAETMRSALEKIATDFIPDRPSEEATALREIRECAETALSAPTSTAFVRREVVEQALRAIDCMIPLIEGGMYSLPHSVHQAKEACQSALEPKG